MRRYFVFAAINLALLLSTISGTAVSVAIPDITTDLQTSLIMVGWIFSGYSLVYTVIMPLTGKITDVLGKRNTFVVSTLLFTAGSTLCALSPNIYFLIFGRIIQAIGGGAVMPCAAGITSDEFPEARQRFIGLLSSVFPFGFIIGPNLGGWLVESFGWRWVFLFNIPLGIVVIVLSMLLLPGRDKKIRRVNIDFVGAGLMFGALFAFMFGLTEIGNNRENIPWTLVALLFTLAIGMVVGFIHWEQRVKEPLIDLALLRNKPFMAANAYNFFYGVTALGVRSLIPLYAVSVYAMSTLQSGIMLTPWSIGMIVASTVTSIYLIKWGYRWPILIGSALLALGYVLLALKPQGIEIAGLHIGVTPFLLILMALPGIGTGICTPAANNACIELMPEKIATITGIRGMFRQVGSAIGVAIAAFLIHSIADAQQAYSIVLLGTGGLILVALPTIFLMPGSADVNPLRNKR